jgi:segregation and condensation protein A
MEQISFKLDVFEGPLDLLLHLISKHKLNINDIPISELVEQYLSYIDSIAEQNMEIAGEFLEMAARLIYIKTASLLPQHEEAEELKKELQGKLIEYSLCKRAAELLKKRYIGNIITVRKQMKIDFDSTYAVTHDSNVLYEAYINISVKKEEMPVTFSSFNAIVSRKIVSVTSKILFVLRKLYAHGMYHMDMLFDGMTDRSERVATFLAVLELTKSGRVILSDDNSEIFFNRQHRRSSEDLVSEIQ